MESVLFDKAEEVVAAGSASGSIKIWDLNSAQSGERRPPERTETRGHPDKHTMRLYPCFVPPFSSRQDKAGARLRTFPSVGMQQG